MRIQEIVHPDDLDTDLASLRRLLSAEITSYTHEKRYLRKGGGIVWAEVTRAVVRDDHGEPLLVAGAVRDVTGQRAAEAEIRAAASYNRSLVEASVDPLVAVDMDGIITDVIATAGNSLEIDRSELVGTEFSGYFTEPALARAGYERAIRDGPVRDYPLKLRHSDGHVTPVLCNASVYRDPAGQALGVLAAVHDVTEIRRAEAALRESQERLSALFDNAPVGIVEMAPSGEITRVNSRVCQLTGYSADELLSMRTGDLVDPAERAEDIAGLRRLLSGEIDSYPVESGYRRKDGGTALVEANRAMVRDDRGEPLLIVGTVRDTTAQREAEAEVRALAAELETRVAQRTADLERVNRNLEAFTYSVSHDLRAPLRALSGFSDALAEECSDCLGETGRGYTDRIQAASEKMAALIDDLLHLSRVSRAEMSPQPVDLSAAVADVAADLQASEPNRQVRFVIKDGVLVTADRTLIHTVVQNLVENAWKFTAHRDDATIEFSTAAAADEGRICCYVRDNGVGFDPAFAGKLFQPFQRLHRASDFPGTGIGLASVLRIVERHGGQVRAESAVGAGATFYFTLPRAQ